MGKGKFSPGNRHLPDDEILLPDPGLPEDTDDGEPITPDTETEPAAPVERPDAETDDMVLDADDTEGDDREAPAPSQPRRRSRTGTLIFYTLYFLSILLFLATVFLFNHRLEIWLTDYQRSQPTDKRNQVFSELFADPDWDAIYEAAKLEDTAYEGRTAFAEYMSALVGTAELELVETSTGLSGNRKYFIKLGSDSIASFLLEAEDDPITGLPRWELGTVEVYFHRSESVTILIQEGQTAYVNGIPLSDSHTTRVDSLLAKYYLPTGIYPHRSYTQDLAGLLVEPEITVLDESGQTVAVTYDAETDIYFTEAPVFPADIPESSRRDVTDAARAYGAYLLSEAEPETLTAHFDRTTDVWGALQETDPFDQESAVYVYDTETVSNYRQYAEDLFSVRVGIRFLSTPLPEEEGKDKSKDKTEPEPTEHIWEHTLFFRYDGSKWICIGLTDDTEPQGDSQVRITYIMDGNVISGYYYDTALRELVVPIVSAPDGRVFAGWYREEAAPDGSTSLVPIFCPDSTGLVKFPEAFTLEPMTLYALFEDASTETEVTN